MHTKIAVGLFAAALLSFASTALAGADNLALHTNRAGVLATPVPKFQLAACRFWPCNCRRECIRWDQNGNCTGTYNTCDTCSKCDD
jgi:hypothetical protein